MPQKQAAESPEGKGVTSAADAGDYGAGSEKDKDLAAQGKKSSEKTETLGNPQLDKETGSGVEAGDYPQGKKAEGAQPVTADADVTLEELEEKKEEVQEDRQEIRDKNLKKREIINEVMDEMPNPTIAALLKAAEEIEALPMMTYDRGDYAPASKADKDLAAQAKGTSEKVDPAGAALLDKDMGSAVEREDYKLAQKVLRYRDNLKKIEAAFPQAASEKDHDVLAARWEATARTLVHYLNKAVATKLNTLAEAIKAEKDEAKLAILKAKSASLEKYAQEIKNLPPYNVVDAGDYDQGNPDNALANQAKKPSDKTQAGSNLLIGQGQAVDAGDYPQNGGQKLAVKVGDVVTKPTLPTVGPASAAGQPAAAPASPAQKAEAPKPAEEKVDPNKADKALENIVNKMKQGKPFDAAKAEVEKQVGITAKTADLKPPRWITGGEDLEWWNRALERLGGKASYPAAIATMRNLKGKYGTPEEYDKASGGEAMVGAAGKKKAEIEEGTDTKVSPASDDIAKGADKTQEGEFAAQSAGAQIPAGTILITKEQAKSVQALKAAYLKTTEAKKKLEADLAEAHKNLARKEREDKVAGLLIVALNKGFIDKSEYPTKRAEYLALSDEGLEAVVKTFQTLTPVQARASGTKVAFAEVPVPPVAPGSAGAKDELEGLFD